MTYLIHADGKEDSFFIFDQLFRVLAMERERERQIVNSFFFIFADYISCATSSKIHYYKAKKIAIDKMYLCGCMRCISCPHHTCLTIQPILSEFSSPFRN